MTDKHAYMLIFHGIDWHKDLSAEETQQVADQWMAWFKGLMADGRAVAGNPLEPGGKVISGAARLVADGPFAESKEAIGGYFLLQVADQDEAVAIARQCPGLPYGIKVEVRAVMDCCPLIKEAATAAGRVAEVFA